MTTEGIVEVIDQGSWDRAERFRFFNKMDYPQFNICANLDITRFLPSIKAQRLSFYGAMIFAAARALNQIPAFRYRIRGEQVVLHERVHPSFTSLPPGSELFKIVTVELEDSLAAFAAKAKQQAAAQECFISPAAMARDDLIYITCIPWVSFTHISHPIDLTPGDSAPRVSWGKYFAAEEKIWLPFSVQAHHALVDGIHIGQYITGLQTDLDTI
jgi:chloramphenicol O-acetyltransferase type A